ncbi:hypothetical protein ACQVP2_20640 [Methylobacterium aquaticum]|jgi:hypothetical protein|uniref:Uncharacterized protein n=1 Tax=Methylobacterium aquaticum TaxID=270351 RepID=A0A0J6UPQ0_9HYPH|nr:hypothetical protein [Methylobacterium aquaticum]KMO28006.1 hypothetical protein VP06_28825 [Methylobacterium aquaticum]
MIRVVTAAVLVAAPLLALSGPAFAHGGDREPAGGAFMSSYATTPYASARSPAEARPLDRPAPFFVPESTGSVPALPARRRTHR